jgi:transglutaminase-like putative cysteine protease/Tfp pilus assembly protein PilF
VLPLLAPLLIATVGPAEVLAAIEGEPASHAVARAHADLAAAQAAARRGALEDAAKGFDALGLPAEVRWVGPAENTSGVRFAEPVEGEDDMRWTARRDPRAGWIDLGAQLPERDEVRVALSFVVESEAEQPAALRIGASGQVAARVGGRDVLTVDGERDAALDQRAAGLWLARGSNRVVLRLGNVDGDLVLYARLTTPAGEPLPGVKLRATAAGPLRAAPARTPPAVVDPLAAARAEPAELDPAVAGVAARVHRALSLGDRRAPVPRVAALAERWAAGEGGAAAWTLAGDAWLPIDVEAARARYLEALALDDAHGRAQLGLARVFDELERPESARAAYRRALALAPDDDEVVDAAWMHELLQGARPVQTARALKRLTAERRTPLLLSAALEEAERVGDAAWRAELLAALEARDVADEALLGARRRAAEARAARSGDAGELRAHLALRLRHDPSDHGAAHELVLALWHAGDRDRARALVDERRASWPARPEPSRAAAALALLAGDRETAQERAAEALQRAPGDTLTLRMHRALTGDAPAMVDVEAARAAAAHRDAAAAGYEVVERRVRVTLLEGGLGSTIREEILRVVDPARAEAARTRTLGWVEGREVATVLEAARISKAGARSPAAVEARGPDGKVDGQYTDARVTVVDFGRIEAGDLLVTRTRVDRLGRPWFLGAFFGVVEGIGGEAPVGRFVLEVDAPEGTALVDGGRGYEVERDGALWRYTASDVGRVVGEPWMPAYVEVAPHVSVSTIASWSDLGRWYESLVEPQLRPDAGLRALAKILTDGAGDDREKVRRVYEHVVRSVRYVGIELGIHGWRPYPVTEVLRRGYGDCKDTASLIVALLDEVGVEARVVLVRTRDRGTPEPEPPSMWMFNHAIAWVPVLDLFLDGTATDAGLDELPDFDRGAFALVVGEDRPRVIPPGAAGANENRSSYVVELSATGDARVTGAERFKGARASEARALLAREARAQVIEGQLAAAFAGARVVELEPTSLALADAEVGYDLVVEVPAFARGGEEMSAPITLYPHELEAAYARGSTRTHELVLGPPGRTVNVMRFVAPEGWEVQDLPPSGGGEVEGALRFQQDVERTADGWTVTETLEVLGGRVPADRYGELRAFARASDERQRARVTLRRGGRS